MSKQHVILITGGAKGVGRGISEAFLATGAKVLVCGREQPAELPAVGDNKAEFIATDVRDTTAVDALFAGIAERFGRLDVLVNNAGGSPFAMADKASPRFHEKIFALNLLAPFHFAQKANALMQAQAEGGSIIFIGSVSALRPSPGTAAYGASKAAVLSLVQSLGVEWAPKVRVSAVSPGPVLTEQADLHYGDAAGVAAVAKTIPMQRLANPIDIGNACVWLSSPGAAYVSGINIVLHGGGERPAFLDASTVNKP
ncbi:SDR family oxidoreductase [Stenotrophobium rhamnosiphilum]|uniref:Short chain dehydrogenase n=1 Tax=Stenotrophobium rhamnosiphilum TaxID=2029166 RepID=A0A2T5MCF8_9GAMM|nr:SDR family oxidoreductase [Stenotrophobium rhamnosiphilum]PTU30256.1 short chain dehydrogenase [Stenotrophobium rhamnosiphilum]